MERNFKKLDSFVNSKKYQSIKDFSSPTKGNGHQGFVYKNERLTLSDTEAEKTIRAKLRYEETNSSVGVQDFEFLAALGKGGYGSVWLVKRKATADLYALKVIKFNNQEPNVIENLVNENRILMNLVGDYVVKGIFSFIHNRYYCVVMELMIGGDFRALIEQETVFDEDDVKFYAAELMIAVSHIQDQGIIHRDLKPENMLLDNKGHLKLADFGLSNQERALYQREDEDLCKANLDVSIMKSKRRKETHIFE